MAGLIYEVGSRELQVGTSFFLPKQGGEELNTKMITGSLLGAITLAATSFPTAETPILIGKLSLTQLSTNAILTSYQQLPVKKALALRNRLSVKAMLMSKCLRKRDSV